MSDFWLNHWSIAILHVCKQWRLWPDCTDEPLLVVYVISTIISWAGSLMFCSFIHKDRINEWTLFLCRHKNHRDRPVMTGFQIMIDEYLWKTRMEKLWKIEIRKAESYTFQHHHKQNMPVGVRCWPHANVPSIKLCVSKNESFYEKRDLSLLHFVII